MKTYSFHDYRYGSKILLSIIPTPGHEDYGLKIFMLKFYFKVFKISCFQSPLIDLNYIWYNK